MKKIIYIWLVRIVSWLAHFKSTDQVIYLMSFADNLDFIRQLADRLPQRVTVYYLPGAQAGAKQLAAEGIATQPFQDSIGFALHGVPVLTRAADIYLDNYYAFTAGLTRRPNQRMIQLWHAAGAVKTFGWGDPQTVKRSAGDQRRFQAVYNQITDYVVGADKMGQVFADSYHVPMARMRVLGYPRSDRYRQSKWVQQTAAAIYQRYPDFKQQEVILYAPTYRAGVQFALPTDFDQLQLRANQRLIIKLHPHLASQERDLQARFPDQVTLVPEFSTDELLTVASTLISDYSSVVFDYALLPNCQKMIFYVFDWQHYEREVGLQADFKEWAPGPMVTTMAELNQVLAAPAQPMQLTNFNQLWNTRNDGHAGERTLAYFYPHTTTHEQ
ncbi:CDP-glycerol glycerophosphotransferase family protein [Lactobacillus pentosus]|uniref:CDP-glycerol glycerophosphotransferase family protein n=1 Tax=Lactiplantibacillus pentosus TaxID=1589 RepID=A0ABD7IQ36_LACPE|nr:MULTISPECIES: CDP-glycerol glycerophosphotransferase family protein [Lactiplantibacillus]MCH4130464.1 CDP-glycerol glycerophosphotransferase family protein [Lactiplantibacillus sp.]BBM23270.1 glycosyl/glycerophosphate transferase, teichoic acid biosynthesis protein B precursor [Lactiplantibacillus plantarum]MCM8608309.1 CDP-glycerol glycerophosphotransferase family protein [Lactiplantibacillus sp. B652]MCT3286534.1 CDP-glycerol glycerophosphotransferase family protein [Lactiplantibacillus pe